MIFSLWAGHLYFVEACCWKLDPKHSCPAFVNFFKQLNTSYFYMFVNSGFYCNQMQKKSLMIIQQLIETIWKDSTDDKGIKPIAFWPISVYISM